MIGGDNPPILKPLKIIKLAKDSGINIVDIFQELAKRMDAKSLLNVYRQKLVTKWRAGELSPELFNSKIDALDTVQDSYNRFVNSIIQENILRPFNSPPHKIETIRDWADAIETLYGFSNYFEQAIYTKTISKKELEDLEMFCNQYTTIPATCLAPCEMIKKGVFTKEPKCRVIGKTIDIKDKPKKPIIIKGIAFRNILNV